MKSSTWRWRFVIFVPAGPNEVRGLEGGRDVGGAAFGSVMVASYTRSARKSNTRSVRAASVRSLEDSFDSLDAERAFPYVRSRTPVPERPFRGCTTPQPRSRSL